MFYVETRIRHLVRRRIRKIRQDSESTYSGISPYGDQLNSQYGERTTSRILHYTFTTTVEKYEREFRKLHGYMLVSILAFYPTIGIWFAVTVSRIDGDASTLFVILSLVAMCIIQILILMLALSLLRAVPFIRRRYYLSPDGGIFLAASEIIDLTPDITRDIQKRRRIIKLLEGIAIEFESTMPAALGLDRGDPSDASVDHLRRVAEFIRSLKVWVAFPQVTTPEDLRQELLSVIAPIATQRYHDLHAVEKLTITSTRVRWQHHLMRAIRQIFVAVIPIAVLLSFTKALGTTIPPGIGTYITIGCVAWAVIVLLSVLDPNYRDNATTVAGLLASFKPGK